MSSEINFQNPPPKLQVIPFYIPSKGFKINANPVGGYFPPVYRNFVNSADFRRSYPHQTLCCNNPPVLRLNRMGPV